MSAAAREDDEVLADACERFAFERPDAAVASFVGKFTSVSRMSRDFDLRRDIVANWPRSVIEGQQRRCAASPVTRRLSRKPLGWCGRLSHALPSGTM